MTTTKQTAFNKDECSTTGPQRKFFLQFSLVITTQTLMLSMATMETAAQLFDELLRDGHLQWVRPITLLRTQKSFNSVLDFVFLVNRQALPGLTGMSRILNREGDSVATAVTYTDNNRQTDHRPVDATFTITIPSLPGGGHHFNTIQPISAAAPRAIKSRSLLTQRGSRTDAIAESPTAFRSERRSEPSTGDLLRRLDNIEEQLAKLRSELRRQRDSD